MTVTFVKGLGPKVEATGQRAHQPQSQLASAGATSSTSSQNSSAVRSDAAVTTSVRFNRNETTDKVREIDKAEKLAKSLSDRILGDQETGIAAHGEFPVTAVRDHFAP